MTATLPTMPIGEASPLAPYDPPTIYAEVPEPLRVTGYTCKRRDPGADLAHEARDFISRFFYLRSDAAMDLFILWGAMTNLVDSEQRTVLDTLALLCLDSAEPGCGKTRGVDMMDNVLCGNAKKVAMPTPAAILGYIDRSQHTILQDESDTVFGNGGDSKKLRGIMLDSYSDGGFVPTGDRSAPGGVREVDVHVPYLWAGLRQTLRSSPTLNALRTRTLFCPLEKPPESVKVERFRRKLHGDRADMLRMAFKQWGKDNAPLAAELIPELPEAIRDRAADLWEPLYVTALLLGGDWPDRCERACVVLAQGGAADNDEASGPQTPLEFLLRDMAVVFAAHGNPERLASRDVVHGLLELPDSPWRKWLASDPNNVTITGGKEIAKTVAARSVSPCVMKVDGLAVRGYERSALMAAGMPDLPATTEDDDVAW